MSKITLDIGSFVRVIDKKLDRWKLRVATDVVDTAKLYVPIDTGRLRGSIKSMVVNKRVLVVANTNYAWKQETKRLGHVGSFMNITPKGYRKRGERVRKEEVKNRQKKLQLSRPGSKDHKRRSDVIDRLSQPTFWRNYYYGYKVMRGTPEVEEFEARFLTTALNEVSAKRAMGYLKDLL